MADATPQALRETSLMDRRLIGVAALAIVAVGLLVVFLGTPGPTSLASQAPPSIPTGPSPTPGPTADAKAPLIKPITVVDGLFDAQPKRSVLEPTRSKNQSKLFFAYGSWWGVLQEPQSREAHIQRLDWATQLWHDTGTVVDERSFARADVVFTGDKLYVASAGAGPSPVQAVRVSVFDYDKTMSRWTREPDYPVTVNPAGVVSVLIEHAADGTLWVAYVESGKLFVAHSVGDPHHWVTPYQPTVAGTAASDQVGMVAVGGDVVLIWSAIHDEAIYSTTHHDGTPDDAWTPATVILKGLALADDHVNVKALPDGRLFAAVKTSLDTVPNAQPGWDQIILLDRKDGTWSSQQFGQIHDKHTRPIVLLDTAQNQVLVFATAPTGGGAIYMKASPFDDIRLPVGLGAEVISSSADPRITDATSTKQTVDATTGLVVLAADNTTGRYVHLAASLGGPEPGGAAVAGGAPPAGPVIAPATPTDLVFEPMEAFTPGTPIQPIWQTSTTRDSGTVTYVTRAPGDVAAQAVTTSSGELRPCRTFATTATGMLTMTMAVRLDRQGANDTTLIMARGAAQELASIRVDRRFRVRISRVGKRETTTLLIRPGAWYRITLRLDVSHRTFETFMLDAAGHTLLRRPAQPWRAPKVGSVDAVCVSPSVGTVAASVSFDDVRVTRAP